jgi:hypothetical protein
VLRRYPFVALSSARLIGCPFAALEAKHTTIDLYEGSRDVQWDKYHVAPNSHLGQRSGVSRDSTWCLDRAIDELIQNLFLTLLRKELEACS